MKLLPPGTAEATMRILNTRWAAERVRKALEAIERDDVPQFKNFPHGSCAYASILLGEYLQQESLGHWTLESGAHRASSATHAWLERDGWILDITADQFRGQDEPILHTRDRAWHNRWASRMASQPANLTRDFNGSITGFYERVIAEIASTR